MNIYVGNIAYQVTESELRAAFEAYGEVESAKIIVEMASTEQAQAAIAGMNGKDLKGRKLNVNEARPRQDDPRGGGMRRGGGRY